MNFNDMLNRRKNGKASNKDKVNTENNDYGQDPVDEELNIDPNAPVADEQQEPTEGLAAEEKLKADLVNANDKYLRLYAEFDNFRRRTNKERADERLNAGKDTIVALLPVLDDFERAIKAMDTANDVVPVKEGVALIQNKLKKVLAAKGLTEMEAKGVDFDADIHEAITSIPAPTDNLKGKVVDELEKGYYLNDKVIRFAKVVVGS